MSAHVMAGARPPWVLWRAVMAGVRRNRALRLIERELAKADPHLREMFAIFAGLNRDERPTGPEPVPRDRGAWRRPAAVALVPLLALGLVVGLVGALAPRPGVGLH